MPKVWGIHDAADPSLGPASPPSGCGFHRIVSPLGALRREMGWNTAWRAGSPPADMDADIVVGERFDRPDVLGHWRRLRLRHKLVYEIDDDVFGIDPLNWGAWQAYRLADVQDAVAHCAAVADLVTVSTEPLAGVMREHNPNVVVLKNCIPAEMLRIERPRREHLTIGWAGGASHTRDLGEVAVPLRRFLDDDCKDARLHLVGTDFRPTLGHNRARFTNWQQDFGEYCRVLDFDIGLAPLSDHPFNRSKSHLKALEYAALGIPVIASDAEPYRDFVIDGVTGFLVSRMAQWRDRLRLLASDAALRESMGAKARELAAQHTIEGNAWRWAEAYQAIL